MKKSVVLCLALFYFFCTGSIFAQENRFSFNKYINDKGDTLNYRMLVPDNSAMQRYPLLIFLHGSGERGDDNEAQLKWGVLNFATDQMMAMHPAIIIAPQCPENQVWADFSYDKKTKVAVLHENPSKSMELVIELILKLEKEQKVDANRVYITGLSMGGFGTFDAIERYPDLFAAAVPVCGGGDPSKAQLIADVPIWIFHGSEDPTVDPGLSLMMFEALTKAGAHPGFTQYPATGHFSWLAAYSDQLMIEWLFRQHR